MNLCTNAAHAMDGEGILDIRLYPVDLSESDLADQHIVDIRPGPCLKLRVSDTGCGIDAKTMERIFDPYFTTKEVGKGSGLGLAVVHGIVKRHDGAITVMSEPGKGTEFSVYIPRIETAAEVPVETPHKAPIGYIVPGRRTGGCRNGNKNLSATRLQGYRRNGQPSCP